jgi:hypothetical protein
MDGYARRTLTRRAVSYVLKGFRPGQAIVIGTSVFQDFSVLAGKEKL